MTIAAALPVGVLAALGLTATWTDVTARRIPNRLTAATLLAGLAFTFHQAGPWSTGSHALHGLAALVVGMALFAVGAIGGGDAKFYAAVATWFAPGQAWLLFVLVSGWGLFVLIVWFVVRRVRGQPIRRQGGGVEGVPYGVAIAAGGITLASLGIGI